MRRHSRMVMVLVMTLLALLLPASVQANAGGTPNPGPAKYPAYYGGQVVTILMGPSGNSQNDNQLISGCFGLGPKYTGSAADAATLPVMYGLYVPGATQMSCPGTGLQLHDMVLTAVPGDPGYSPWVVVAACLPGAAFDASKMPYTSAAAVENAVAAGELSCTRTTRVLLSPVVGGHTQ